MPIDQEKIFAAIERLPGGFDGLNKEMRRAQRKWLAESAEGVLGRTDPHRSALTGAELARESCTGRLLEAWPRLPHAILGIGLCAIVAIVVEICKSKRRPRSVCSLSKPEYIAQGCGPSSCGRGEVRSWGKRRSLPAPCWRCCFSPAQRSCTLAS